jgi:hypothetical protein
MLRQMAQAIFLHPQQKKFFMYLFLAAFPAIHSNLYFWLWAKIKDFRFYQGRALCKVN